MVHIPIVSRLSFGDYRSITFTFIILGIETCFRLIAYLIPGVILDAGKALVEKYAAFCLLIVRCCGEEGRIPVTVFLEDMGKWRERQRRQ
jgi:hypothetical protein